MTEQKEKQTCEVKGCDKKTDYMVIGHSFGDRYICEECLDKYFKRS